MIALWLAACVAGPGEALPLPDPDPAVFAAEVQPVLAVSCANPACHGTPERPLSVYAPGRWRLDDRATFRDEPLTDEELAHNLASATAFLVGVEDALECELVARPLAPGQGGQEHGGGTVWADTGEPGFQAVFEWVADSIGEAP